MINALRTALLNTAVLDRPGPGDEFIDPSYIPVSLPEYLRVARDGLFGVGHDYYGRNCTVARVLTVVEWHSGLRSACREPDNRVSYKLPYPPTPSPNVPPGVTIQADGDAFPNQPGRGYGKWAVSYSSPTVTIREIATGTSSTCDIAVPSKPLPNSALFASFDASSGFENSVLEYWRKPTHVWSGFADAYAHTLSVTGSAGRDAVSAIAVNDPQPFVRSAAAALCLAFLILDLRAGS